MAQKYIEKGDIYLFYRNKVDIEKAKNLNDVQRLYMVLLPDESEKARLFVVGKKQLPDIVKGKAKSTERNWLMNTTMTKPDKLSKALGPITYETKTKGKRKLAESIPAAEGRYVLFERDDSTQLAYKMENPKTIGVAQKELGIRSSASYVISVRNPEVSVRGFPEEKPDYPKYLKEKFADERWLDLSEPKLMNYENAQLLIIGAHDDLNELDIKITGKPNLFKNLGMKKDEWPTETLEKGKFATPKRATPAREPEADRTKGGRRGGEAAVNSISAAGLAKALQGIKFPKKHEEVVSYAKSHGAKNDIVDLLEELPHRKFKTMADVQKALSEVR